MNTDSEGEGKKSKKVAIEEAALSPVVESESEKSDQSDTDDDNETRKREEIVQGKKPIALISKEIKFEGDDGEEPDDADSSRN